MKFPSLIVAYFLLITHLCPTERGWNSPELAEAYHHHSRMQYDWAMELIEMFPFKNRKKILDFGCGDGKITAWISQKIPDGTVTGYDISSSMIQLAQNLYSSENLHFQTTEICEKYDLICSFCVLHFVDDPLAILIDLKSHLHSDGLLLLTIPGPINPSRRSIASGILKKYGVEPPWMNRPSYTQELSIRSLRGSEIYLEQAGFEIISIREEHTPYLFPSVNDYIDWWVGTGTANWGVPLSLSHSMYTEYVTKILEQEPEILDPLGRISENATRIHVIARPK